MGNFNKWNKDMHLDPNRDLTVVLFTSRNKDNKHLEGFRERRKAFVTTRKPDKLISEFNAFVDEGLTDEMSRMYISVNKRSNAKTQKQLIHQLIDNDYNLATLPQRIAAIAALKENAADSKHLKWLFDFDPTEDHDTDELLNEFVDDILYYHNNTMSKHDETRPEINIEKYKTPNGYAVIVDQRFDTRQLLEKWTNVELKRDDLLCYKWDWKQ